MPRHNLVKLNLERRVEEAQCKIRWLRPDYQNQTGAATQAKNKQGETAIASRITVDKPALSNFSPEQVAAERGTLSGFVEASPHQVARAFKRGRAACVAPHWKG